MLRRRAVAGLCASLVVVTGCSTVASSSTLEQPTTSATSSSTTIVEPTTTSSSDTTSTVTTPPVVRTAALRPNLVQSLEALWARTAPGSCLMVTEGTQVLFERNPDGAVTPASTMKLLTATAVLERIDPASRLRTPVIASAPPDAGGTINGDIFLVGGGDPVLGTLPYGARFTRQPRLLNAIEVLADRVVAAGVRHVTGRVVGDDGRYERVRYLPSWPARYISDHDSGPLSALAVNDGFERWSPMVPFADPAAGAAGVFNELLRQRGVVVNGDPTSGTAPANGVEVAALDSPTIAELVAEMLLDSDNETAELLLRELGLRVLGAGTTDAGRRVAADTLGRLGLPMAGVTIVDGSGLDQGDRVTCRVVTAILTSSPWKVLVAQALPVAAQTGTLYKRFLATPVAGHLRAKTGSIRSVSALVGYADGADGRTLTFAYEQNNVGSRDGKERQNELGHTLVVTRR